MPIEKVDIHSFLALAKTYPVLDVRSPGEFKQAHVPGALSFPLFNDEERKVVGTAYKNQGRQEAIKIGMEYFGVKMRRMVEDAELITPNFRTVLVHCWRGGMRSEAIAWMLSIYGFKVYLLEGGYKKFRSYVLETFRVPFAFNVLGGFTGSGKTGILQELSREGSPVIDLEFLANHKGSAFGNLGPQVSQEMFENELALALRSKQVLLPLGDSIDSPAASLSKIWVEDESQRIGSVMIPNDLWKQLQHSPVFFLDVPFEQRLERIEAEYGRSAKTELGNAILRIQKRLGGLETKAALKLLAENNMKETFRILLRYYDKCYSKSLSQKQIDGLPVHTLGCTTGRIRENAIALLTYFNPVKPVFNL